jgi:hypothetical protein
MTTTSRKTFADLILRASRAVSGESSAIREVTLRLRLGAPPDSSVHVLDAAVVRSGDPVFVAARNAAEPDAPDVTLGQRRQQQ